MDTNRVDTTVVRRCGRSVKNVMNLGFPASLDVVYVGLNYNIFYNMDDRNNEVLEKNGSWTKKTGEELIKKLREMPYDESRVGQSFIIIPFKYSPKKENDNREDLKDTARDFQLLFGYSERRNHLPGWDSGTRLEPISFWRGSSGEAKRAPAGGTFKYTIL